MNTIGINRSLDRPRIKRLLTMGLFASILTGIGDFLLVWREQSSSTGPGQSDGRFLSSVF